MIPNFPVKTVSVNATSSDEARTQIESWLQQCIESHPGCPRTPKEVSLPTRLLDVSDPEVVKVVETKGMQGQYVCLSHQWGKEPMPIKTTDDNIDEMKKPIPVKSLPLTFQHAASIARAFCKYLWIDSLCIIQDNPGDWKVEAAQMASIYRNGVLTIAAVAATGPKEGLFFSAAPGFADHTLLELERLNLGFPIYVRRHLEFNAGHLQKFQVHGLLERGWVLQERVISPRILYFGYNELAWECMTSTACQCESDFRPYPVTRYSPREPFHPKSAFNLSIISPQPVGQTVEQSLALWHHIINAYTGLDLTFPKDKFPALAGLAVEVGKSRPGDQYLAGVWCQTFIPDLLWRRRVPGDWHSTAFTDHYDLHNCFGGEDGREEEFERSIMHREWRGNRLKRLFPAKVAPTWSWAKMHDQVEYDKDINSLDLGLVEPQFAEVVGVKCSHQLGFGEMENIESAFATLRGKLIQVRLKKQELGSSSGYLLYRNDHAMGFSAVDFGPFDFKSPLYRATELFCLQLASGRVKDRPAMAKHYGLVLMAKNTEDGIVYERVGMFDNAFRFGQERTIFDGIEESTELKIV